MNQSNEIFFDKEFDPTVYVNQLLDSVDLNDSLLIHKIDTLINSINIDFNNINLNNLPTLYLKFINDINNINFFNINFNSTCLINLNLIKENLNLVLNLFNLLYSYNINKISPSNFASISLSLDEKLVFKGLKNFDRV